MVDGEDWLMRPVLRGLVRYESLRDGSLGLRDVYLLNETIDVETENTWRAQKALEGKRKNTSRR
jgi:hypothetical protein